ncbi:hypothetical protein QQZ08_007923 [Neonectria magnoliae]|uniref:NB-ARC domain-containing protein n=1 Tax=Neonectria magnoliae TaxID=2732573 RepID=A0ABR1HXM0_9HYPO
MSGLPPGISEKDAAKMLAQHQTKGEQDIRPEIAILPACSDSNGDASVISILKFPADQQPGFLAGLNQNPMEDITLRFEDNNGARRDITFDRHFHGFTQLYPTARDHPISADIIAITGMDGHAYGSWMSRNGTGAMWLRDFLSRDLPDCRTMIYGYHSKLLALNMSQLKEYGRLFLTEVEKIRHTAELQRRPLIFICHSYGGIVLSHCLVRACLSDNESRKSLYKSTYGMVFFGTPHRGSPKDDVLKMVEQAYPNRVPALLQTGPDSGELRLQLQYFSDIIGDRQIGSFYETEPTPSPVQFASPVDSTYTTVLKMLREFARDAPKVVRQRYDPPVLFPKAQVTVPFTRSTNFFGREDTLARLEEIFDATHCHCRAALTGLGGIGKSAIAINYALRHQKRHPDTSIFWVQATTAARFSQSYREIAEALKIDGRDEPKVDILKLVYDYLSDESHGPWLIVLDNADDRTLFSTTHTGKDDKAGQYRSLSSFLPQRPHGSVLITSRDRSVAEDLAGSTSSILTVFALDEDDSVRLLRERSGDKHSPNEDALHLVKSLDNIPLAITQAAAFISSGSSSITRYIRLYRKGLKNREQDIPIPQAVSVTWKLSFQEIRKHHHSSFKLLSWMSLLHNDDIPDFLFTENIPKYEVDRSLFEKDISPLLRFSLIIIDGESFDMHRLVQLATRSWLAANHELHHRAREARALVANTFPDISAGFEHWEKCLALLPHAEAALALDVGPKDLRQMTQHGKLLYNMAYYEYIKGDHAMALNHSVAAKEIQSEFLKDDDKQLILTKTLIFRLFSELGQWEKAIHEVDSELSGLHDRGPGVIHSNEYLALLEERSRIMLDVGNLKEAEEGARSALRLMMAQDGVSEVHKLDAKRTLARAINFQGEPEQAEALFRQVLSRRKQLWSLDHVDTLKSVVDLAQCLANQGRYNEAWRHFETASTGLKKFPDQENTRAQKVERLWEETRAASQQRGWSRLRRSLQAMWRRTKLRIFGSPRASLTPATSLAELAPVWRLVFSVLTFLAVILLAISLQKSEELMRMPQRLGEDWTRHERRISRKMEDNEALDRDQNEEIQQLKREVEKIRQEKSLQIRC